MSNQNANREKEPRGQYPKTGQKFYCNGQEYKWKPYHKSVQKDYGKGRFQRVKWSGADEDGDFFKWVNDNPPANSAWSFER